MQLQTQAESNIQQQSPEVAPRYLLLFRVNVILFSTSSKSENLSSFTVVICAGWKIISCLLQYFCHVTGLRLQENVMEK